MSPFTWTSFDWWTVATAGACAAACAVVGCFLLLRKLSMMGDAISHAVLPGLVIAFLLTGSRDALPMLVGAAVVGLLTAFLTELVLSSGKVDEGASMGVVFTTLFALGLLLVARYSDHIDLDPSCVLLGQLEMTPFLTVTLAGVTMPKALAVLLGVLLFNVAAVAVFWKELKLAAFDPALATALGFPARLMHYLLMTLVAVTTVASFEAVGSILVVAMLVVPAAAASLLTHRLLPMLLIAVALAMLSALLGHAAAIEVPRLFSRPATETSGMMAVSAGVLLMLAVAFSPQQGLLPRAWRAFTLRLSEARDDLLATLYRVEERRGVPTPAGYDPLAARPLLRRLASLHLHRRGLLAGDRLTEPGRARARELLRSHRLWETYLVTEANIPADHTHATAERLEHVTDAPLRAKLAEAAPNRDPQGREIPPEA